jgi:hypothetical protein
MTPTVVSHRVDWLTMAYKVTLNENVLRSLVRDLEAAPDAQRCAVELGGDHFELKQMRSGARYLLRNADVAVVVDPKACEGWTVQVEHPGATMMRTEPERALEISRRLATALGSMHGERCRRLDLAADVAGFDVQAIDDQAWVKHSRAKLERAADVDKSDSPVQRRFRRGTRVTGYSICPGNVVMGCIYDKREELTIRSDKRAAEEARWTDGGWDGAAPVTRVEFRFRSEALNDLSARDGASFLPKLDALWQYATRWWLRLVDLATDTRVYRCKVTPEWQVVQALKFRHEASPAIRRRIRLGASPGQVLGAALSVVAAAGMLLAPVPIADETGAPLAAPAIVQRMSPPEQNATVFALVSATCAEASALVAADLLERLGPARAAIWLLQRQDAARARFSSCAPTRQESTAAEAA